MIGGEEGGGGVGKNENSIINTFFSVYCSLLGLFRTKNIIRKRNGQVMNKRQMRPGGTFLQIQTDIYIYIYICCGKKRYCKKAFFCTLIYICKRTAFLQKYILQKNGHTLNVAGEFS